MMRCLIVSDLHYSLNQFDWVLQNASKYDLIIIAGDLLDITGIADLRAQILVINKYVQKLSAITNIMVCSGNHDLDSLNREGEKIPSWLVALKKHGARCDGDGFLQENFYFSICPWWDGPLEKERFLNWIEDQSKAYGQNKWIWVHHAPPKMSPTSWSGKKCLGDLDLRLLIEKYQPYAVISGHIHQSPFVDGGSWVDRIGETFCLNAGRQFGAPPAHISFDTQSQEVYWVSAMDIQSINFQTKNTAKNTNLVTIPHWMAS